MPPPEELSFKLFRGHAVMTGTRVDETKPPFPVYGASPVPSSESTLSVAEQVEDAEYTLDPATPFNV